MTDFDEPKPWYETQGKWRWAICPVCDGEGQVDNPAFSNGISMEEWRDEWDDESRENYLNGVYDVPCPGQVGFKCHGGKVRLPIMANLSFADKRQLVRDRHEAQFLAEWKHEREVEARMLGEY